MRNMKKSSYCELNSTTEENETRIMGDQMFLEETASIPSISSNQKSKKTISSKTNASLTESNRSKANSAAKRNSLGNCS